MAAIETLALLPFPVFRSPLEVHVMLIEGRDSLDQAFVLAETILGFTQTSILLPDGFGIAVILYEWRVDGAE